MNCAKRFDFSLLDLELRLSRGVNKQCLDFEVFEAQKGGFCWRYRLRRGGLMVWLEGRNIKRVLRGRWRIVRYVHGDVLLGVDEIPVDHQKFFYGIP